MFSGIVEGMGRVERIEREGSNYHFTLSAPFAGELHVDQSLAHDGVCLTVVELLDGGQYRVTAVEETLLKSNMGELRVGDMVNLERSMAMNGRLDGHIVQGHVDTTARCTGVESREGSWYYSFEYTGGPEWITVEKGSICVNGVSLTVVNSKRSSFQVAIIPYTHDVTNFQYIREGTLVNLEFDIIGKYIARYMEQYGVKG